MPKKHRGPYLPSHGEPVTDKTRRGEVVALHYGSTPDVVDVAWQHGSAPERVPSSTLSHDYAGAQR
jgi:hypothetical protein